MVKRKYEEMLGEDVDFQWKESEELSHSDDGEEQEDKDSIEEEKVLEKSVKKKKTEKGAVPAHLQKIQIDPITAIEREIAADPKSAKGHIKLIAYYVATQSLDKARHAASVGLKRLPIEALDARFRIFSAWIRLEYDYGTEEDQRRVFDKALLECGTMYRRKLQYLLAGIYEEKGDIEKSEEIYRKVAKKYGQEPEVWDTLFEFLIKHGKHLDAKDVLKRSQQALPTKQLKMRAFSIFAIKQYKLGSILEGHKMMENIVATYPDRTDMWNVFLDMELGAKRFDEVRKIFDRIVQLKLSPKKMKSFLSRYMDFEKNNGTQAGVERVRDLARNYVERISNKV